MKPLKHFAASLKDLIIRPFCKGTSARRQSRFHRPTVEILEDRVMLDSGLPAALAVGRTLSAYTTAAIQNQQETITYTVYNQQADPITGVLLTDTLRPGVTFQSASARPDQAGQMLAWSLGTINGFDRASVTLTVSLPNAIPLQLDTGAQAFGTLNANMVMNFAPAANLIAGSVDPALLASTPDANITDPFIQEEAAVLHYDPQQIFDFLHNDVGYNSYLGSVRGARGTLWSSAGNALDVASLGVALMRASGIPAQYVSGTLSKTQAQQLILSMFPASFQTVGYLPAGTELADPANDPKLLAETQSHYWFQFDTGAGMKDADPLMAGATIGTNFTVSTGTFTEVPGALREKTQVQLTTEIYSQTRALFGLDPYIRTVVLEQMFNDVDLVGHPLSFGFFVSSESAAGLGFAATTNTYSPYLQVGDEAFPDPSQDTVIRGQDFQENFTNFPLGSQIFTGLFLSIVLSGPQGSPQTEQHTILDRIGFAVRQGLASGQVAFDPSGSPAISDFEITTVNVLAGLQNPNVQDTQGNQLATTQARIKQLGNSVQDGSLYQTFAVGLTRLLAEEVGALSDILTAELATGSQVAAYFDRPRITVTSQRLLRDPGGQTATVATLIDLLGDAPRVVAAPGQRSNVPFGFNIARGYAENAVETLVGSSGNPAGPAISASEVFEAANQQGIPITILVGDPGIARLDSLGLHPDARARMTLALQAGQIIMVPVAPVTINGIQTTAWFQTDPVTGFTTGVTADGAHGAITEYAALLLYVATRLTVGAFGVDALVPYDVGYKIGLQVLNFYISQNNGDRQKTIDAVKYLKDKAADQLNLKVTLLFVFIFLPFAGILAINPYVGVAVGGIIQYEVGQLVQGYKDALKDFDRAIHADPPVDTLLANLAIAQPVPGNVSYNQASFAAALTPGTATSAANVDSVRVAGQLTANWSALNHTEFQVASLALSGNVTDGNGHAVGSGSVSMASVSPVGLTAAGNNQYAVQGTGSLSFYGPAESNLGVSGAWSSYTASVTGNTTLTLTTDSLMLNGNLLPAGIYTITTSAATLSGSGLTTSPNFSGSVAINATNSTIDLGPGAGSVTVGGTSLDPTSGVTFTGYSGSIGVGAGGGSNRDAVTLNGIAANVLTVSASPTSRTTDQNTPVTFQTNVHTSLADSYEVSAQGPAGWTVSIDATGKVSATPAPGLQTGTFPIRIVAQSATNPDLVAQTIVNVTIAPTVAGMTLAVNADSAFTVPVGDAQVPTAFQAVIHNDGPVADTYNLTFANIPAGFPVLSSGTSVTVPAGATGIIGVYLQPTGTTLLPPGTPLSFDVTATSATNPAITHAVNESFPMPTVDTVTFTANPLQTTSTPGVATTTTLTLHNAGNVAETVTLTATAAAGLAVTGLTPVSLAIGETKTVTVTLTPAANAALNGALSATITARFASQSVSTNVTVLVRSVEAVAIDKAAVTAARGNNSQMAAILGELGHAVSQLQIAPTDVTLLARVQFLLPNLSTLLSADPALASLTTQLAPIQAKAASADVAGMLALAPTFFTSLNDVLAIEATQQFTASLTPGVVDIEPGQSKDLTLTLVNQGSDPVVLALTAPGLPNNVSALFSHTQVTLPAGATGTETVTLSNTLASSKLVRFTVNAAASLVQHSAQAIVAVRSATADVLSVTVNPTNPAVGDSVSATSLIFNAANVARDVVAHMDILDSGGNVMSSVPNVPIHLVPGTGNRTLNLGQISTTGLTTGVYYLRVSLHAADDTPLPGQSAQAIFSVGQLISASISASPTIVPPGTSTVTTTIGVNSNIGTGPGTAGLVALYNADGNADDSAGSNIGTLIGGVGFAAGTSGASGDQAFTFDGSGNQYVSIANMPSLDFGTGDFSIDLRVKFNSLASDQELFHKVTGLVPNDQTYFLEFNAPNALRFMVRDGAANQNDLIVPTTLATGQWYHITAVRQGDTSRIYVNGILFGSQTAGIHVDTGSGGIARMGRIAPNGAGGNPIRGLDGSLDTIALYHRALSADEVAGAPNLITNGDFSAGKTGFQTDYPPPTFGAGALSIDTNRPPLNPGWATFGDHTTGNGLMLVADGTTFADQKVWLETVSVSPLHLFCLCRVLGRLASQPSFARERSAAWRQFAAS